jgi:hypothetical protein
MVLARELLALSTAKQRSAQKLVLNRLEYAGSSAIRSQYPVHVPAVTTRLVRSQLEGKPCAFVRTALTIPIATQSPAIATVTTIAVIARSAMRLEGAYLILSVTAK